MELPFGIQGGGAASDRHHTKSHFGFKGLEQDVNFPKRASRAIDGTVFWTACWGMQPLTESMQSHAFAARPWNRISTFPKVLQVQMRELFLGATSENAVPDRRHAK